MQKFKESMVYIHAITSSLLWRLDRMLDICRGCWPTETKALSNLTPHFINWDNCETYRIQMIIHTHTNTNWLHRHWSSGSAVQQRLWKFSMVRGLLASKPPGQSEGLGLGRTLSSWDSPPASFCSMEEHHATANHQHKTTSGARSQTTIKRQHISLWLCCNHLA